MSGNLTGFRNRFSRDCSAKPAAIVRKTPGGSVASEFISLPIFGTWLGMNSKPYNVTVTSVAAQPGLRLLADDVDEIAHRDVAFLCTSLPLCLVFYTAVPVPNSFFLLRANLTIPIESRQRHHFLPAPKRF